MTKLLALLQCGHKMVQESALTALASTADNAQAAFAKYYGTVGLGRYSIPRYMMPFD